jgi:hypothetical protein
MVLPFTATPKTKKEAKDMGALPCLDLQFFWSAFGIIDLLRCTSFT